MTPPIRNLCRSPVGRLRRCARPAPIARRCPRRSPAFPLAPARRGYGYGSGSAVVDGMPVVPVQACQGSYAPAQAIGPVWRTGSWYGSALPPARRGYGCRVSTPVVDGTGVGRAQACQGSCAPAQAIGPVWRTGSWYGSALPAPRARIVLRKTAAGGSAYCAAPSRPPESGAFRYSKKAAPLSGACERSEVLTARTRSTLQSRAVFRCNAP